MSRNAHTSHGWGHLSGRGCHGFTVHHGGVIVGENYMQWKIT